MSHMQFHGVSQDGQVILVALCGIIGLCGRRVSEKQFCHTLKRLSRFSFGRISLCESTKMPIFHDERYVEAQFAVFESYS